MRLLKNGLYEGTSSAELMELATAWASGGGTASLTWSIWAESVPSRT